MKKNITIIELQKLLWKNKRKSQTKEKNEKKTKQKTEKKTNSHINRNYKQQICIIPWV